jgi:copper chaperone CopZ
MRKLFTAALMIGSMMGINAAVAGQAQNYDVKIEGMTCDSCVKSVTSALSKLPNIDPKSVKVVLKAKTATLTMNDAKPETIEAIKKAIATAGYKVTAVNTIATAPSKN